MEKRLNEEQIQVLKTLAEELKLNPKTSLTGIDMKILGDKVGAYRGIGVMYSVDKLRRMGLVSRRQNKVLITQKGLKYIQSHDREFLDINITGISRFIRWIWDNFILALLIAIIAGLIVAAIVYGWRP